MELQDKCRIKRTRGDEEVTLPKAPTQEGCFFFAAR
jgi:hypothetical protein